MIEIYYHIIGIQKDGKFLTHLQLVGSRGQLTKIQTINSLKYCLPMTYIVDQEMGNNKITQTMSIFDIYNQRGDREQ